MLILSSIPRGLEFWSVNDNSIYENSESKVLKTIKCLGEISNKRPNVNEQMYTRLLNLVDNRC